MSISQPKRKILIISAVVVALLLATSTSYFFFVQNRELTREEIDEKFECNRTTADVRHSDVFCYDNPMFYNNPENVTEEEYSAYIGCEKSIKEPDETSVSWSDRQIQEICKNQTLLQQKHSEFKEALMELKNDPDKQNEQSYEQSFGPRLPSYRHD